jgi:small subunit ribosomal protein S6
MTTENTRLYETIFIVRPDVESGQVDTLKEQVSDLLSNLKAPQVRWESWGRRKLAFPIQKANKGTYLYVLYLGAANAASELERVLRLNENVLRSLTVRVLDDVDQGSFDFQEWFAKSTSFADYGDESDSNSSESTSGDSDKTETRETAAADDKADASDVEAEDVAEEDGEEG